MILLYVGSLTIFKIKSFVVFSIRTRNIIWVILYMTGIAVIIVLRRLVISFGMFEFILCRYLILLMIHHHALI